MTGQTVILRGTDQRALAKRLIDAAPVDYVVTIKEPTRTVLQSAKMWAMLQDISQGMAKHGVRYSRDDWKARVMHACGWECQFLPGILDGKPFPAGFRSSQLTVKQMAALIEYMYAEFSHLVQWQEPHPDEQ